MEMIFNFKMTIPGGQSYEEDIYISDEMVADQVEAHEFDEIMHEKLRDWVLENVEYEWEKNYE